MPTYQPVSYGGFGAPAAVYPTAASVPMAARAAGMSYDELVVRVLALATLG